MKAERMNLLIVSQFYFYDTIKYLICANILWNLRQKIRQYHIGSNVDIKSKI